MITKKKTLLCELVSHEETFLKHQKLNKLLFKYLKKTNIYSENQNAKN